jgi:hypothetical protein
MPLKLPKPEKVSQEVLDQRYILKHKVVLKGLAEAVEGITRAHRDEYEVWLNAHHYKAVDYFVKKRGTNGTTRDVYGDPHDEKPTERKYTITDVPGPRFLRSTTNYYEAVKRILPKEIETYYGKETYWADQKKNEEIRVGQQIMLADKNRPSFEVKFKADAKEVIAKEVKREVDMIVSQFVYKTSLKMVGILRANPNYKATLITGSFKAGTFQGEIKIALDDGQCFTIRLYLKTNFRNGEPYLQWPLTFHDVNYKQADKPAFATMMPQDTVERVFNAVQREPDKDTMRHWTSVGVGYVVRLKNQKLGLVVSTRNDKAKILYYNGDQAEATAEDIEIALHKIKARLTFGNGHHYAYVESADPEVKVARQDLTQTEQIAVEAIGSYEHTKKETKTREIVFKRLLKDKLI